MHDEVISAFLDHESFDPAALGRALADPAGRELLIDAIALRHLVNDDVAARPAARARSVWAWRGLAAAAALALAVGAYAVGRERALQSHRDVVVDAAPAPTQVIDLKPGIEWETRRGGH